VVKLFNAIAKTTKAKEAVADAPPHKQTRGMGAGGGARHRHMD
jgi:hypothetical protein